MNERTAVFETEQTGSPYADLAAAIVKQACRDYESVLVGLYFQKNVKKKMDLFRMKCEIEDFFRSGWYEQLTDIDGERLRIRIREIARQTIRNMIDKERRRVLDKMQKRK